MSDTRVGSNEATRLDALQRLNLLDTPPSESFDRITRLASQLFNLPVAAVSLTDSDRQWFKSRVGMDYETIPRDKAICSQVANTCDTIVIEDLQADPNYDTNGFLVRSGLRFYAGAPLVTRDGYGLGALCVLGTAPRVATDAELGALRDLAAMVMAQIELQHAFGRLDPISGLPNRTQFIEDLGDLARDGGAGKPRVVGLLDLLGFDQFNHAMRVMGPTVIDEMVATSARNFQALIGPHRKAYHVGTTQLASLVPEAMDEISYLEMLTQLSDPIRKLGGPLSIGTAVVGVAPFTQGEVSPTDVLRMAQGAAQDARASGKLFHVHSSGFDTAFQRSFTLLRDFEAALQSPSEFRLVYQPRIDLASGECVCVEALMRWEHPYLGPVSPGEFIPLVERTSLATGLTAWALETAVAQLARWREAGIAVMMSVNISSANLHEPDFAGTVQRILARHRVPSALVELEVTETAVMSDAERSLTQMKELAASGVRLAIDDFGTGYSSLAYLQRLPVQVVKIDRSFMSDVDKDPRQFSLVTMMIAMAKHLGHRVVAEGIETQGALDQLRSADCDEVQGYLISRPLEVAAFEDWLRQRQAGSPVKATAA